ncbi:DUF4097 domain-containing protein [Sulfidibacter corallicola]|uniref:DUF4097 family beta strand repeat protein n=1 Tax=Sulfidibacter corallicola TaxID=2818388 RepID=A0A8A4TH58_SULCO|nr:DUF4097 family beta strand repeat-containing protein [Sulfidibacter corallicola]QTD49399.1 DUF4097 family beta strand repeat protein [Sulfidibacter corallicola]
MIKANVTLLTALSLLWSAPLFAGKTINESYTLAPGQELNIRLKTGGSITVEGWDEDRAEVSYKLRGREEDVVIEAKPTDAGFSIRCEPKFKSWRSSIDVDLVVKAPRLSDVRVYTSGGRLTMKNLEGEFSGKTMGGKIILTALAGSVDLLTMGGDIEVNESTLDGRVKTMGGDIEFTNVVGNVDGSTMGGDVIYDNVKFSKNKKADFTPDDVVKISTMGGDIRVEDAPFGAEVKTMGGEIHITRAAQFAVAKTMGGDIEIGEVDGWAKATTMGGDVTVKMVGDPASGRRDVELGSMGGDITLYVPRELSMHFDLEIQYTKNSNRNYDIHSDFRVQKEEGSGWSWKRGRNAKTIVGTGEVNGGKHKIKIHTVNGHIRIRAVD